MPSQIYIIALAASVIMWLHVCCNLMCLWWWQWFPGRSGPWCPAQLHSPTRDASGELGFSLLKYKIIVAAVRIRLSPLQLPKFLDFCSVGWLLVLLNLSTTMVSPAHMMMALASRELSFKAIFIDGWWLGGLAYFFCGASVYTDKV